MTARPGKIPVAQGPLAGRAAPIRRAPLVWRAPLVARAPLVWRAPLVRRAPLAWCVAVLSLAVILAGCRSGSGGSAAGSDGSQASAGSGAAVAGSVLTVGGADYTEMLIMESMYGQLLTKAGFQVRYQTSNSRDVYTKALESGAVDVVPEYAATMAEFLNRESNGAKATLVASSDPTATVKALRKQAKRKGLAVLAVSQAANQNGFAVAAKYAKQKQITTLSQLAAQGTPLVLAGTPECPKRPFCQLGLERVYGMKFSSSLPLGFGSAETKQAVLDGKANLALVGTTDGTLTSLGLQLLQDDKHLQLADNLIPVVNADSAGGPQVAAALNPLAGVLTTADLAGLNEQVDGERRTSAGVATDYLRSKGLL
jgi:osmoprotectant transport system substrate-binding protein